MNLYKYRFELSEFKIKSKTNNFELLEFENAICKNSNIKAFFIFIFMDRTFHGQLLHHSLSVRQDQQQTWPSQPDCSSDYCSSLASHHPILSDRMLFDYQILHFVAPSISIQKS